MVFLLETARNILLWGALLVMCFSFDLVAQDLPVLHSDLLTVYYDNRAETAALELLDLYPAVKAELETFFLWRIDFRPTVILVSDRSRFRQMVSNPSFVAYALPSRGLIVIDQSRMHVQPFTLRITLKHELCHLLLHRYIPVERLPKWLDEGVSQWVSDGISEIMIPRRTRVLMWASVTGNILSLSSLNSRFPDDDRGLFLAYEQSRSIVEHIVVNHGRNGLLNLLQALRYGLDYHEAIESSLMVSAGEIEKRWRSEQRSWMVLLSHAVAHLYTILFMLGALALLVAYVRFQIRKRQLVDEEDVSSPWGHR
ncbi:MAG TPA: hypothetical protein ENN34_03050 [Deltaproteobacteria bacterium]|nr:hypothetical protein [Deltaproteobacteria bacterium]